MSDREIIDRNGERFVLVPEATYDRMIEDLDELDDIRAYDRATAKPQEFVPAEIVDRLLAGESPLRIWREHRELTQQVLADAVDISTPYLSQLESGQREASVGVLRKLAKRLDVGLDDLMSSPPAATRRSRPKRARAATRRRIGATGSNRS